jgi:nucleoid DNA-binding protein
VKQQTAKAQDRNKTVQIGLILDVLVRIATIVLDRKPGQNNMAKMMTKSELIQKITDRHSDLTKKDVKAVIETMATVAYKRAQEDGRLPASWLCKIRRHQEARHQRACRHQSIHQRADSIQGATGAENH